LKRKYDEGGSALKNHMQAPILSNSATDPHLDEPLVRLANIHKPKKIVNVFHDNAMLCARIMFKYSLTKQDTCRNCRNCFFNNPKFFKD